VRAFELTNDGAVAEGIDAPSDGRAWQVRS
jgi:hypothetical protein